MASCEVCQHCSKTMRPGEAVSKEGYSYHEKCRKCYVCSEINLQDAEIFRGVIFCASCAKRIFRGCATARTAKKAPRRRVTRHRRRRRSPRPRVIEHSVIERARAANSSTSTSSQVAEESKPETAPAREPSANHENNLSVSHDCYCVSDVVTQAKKLINFIYFQSHNLVKNDKAPVRTDTCQQLLDDLKSSMPDTKTRSPQIRLQPISTASNRKASSDKSSTAAVGTSRKKKRSARVKQEKVPCSDLRIAELGASTEIATMALRKNSKKKVKPVSREPLKTVEPETISMFSNLESVVSHTSNEEYLDSECNDYRGSKQWDGGIMDHSFASIVKLPYKYFKKKIIDRSSLISVIAGIDTEKESFYKKFKTLFQEDDILEHHRSGYKKLYSTINKKMPPYKMGWLEQDGAGERKLLSPCKHFDECHSYRCMREQVMRLAGPTKSRMDLFRNNMKNLLVPSFLRNLSLQYRNPKMVKSEACGKSTCTFVSKSPTRLLTNHQQHILPRASVPPLPSHPY